MEHNFNRKEKPSSQNSSIWKILNIGLYCDLDEWILGTIAKQIKRIHGNSGRFKFTIGSWKHVVGSPLQAIYTYRQCDIIHWLIPYGYLDYGSLFSDVKHICTINHCLPDDRLSPTSVVGTHVVTMSGLTQQALLARGFQNVEIIHYGVDITLFHPMSRAFCRQLLNIETSTPLIGFFGKESSNPNDRKGTRTLVTVAAKIAETRPIGFLISGEGWQSLVHELETFGVKVFRRPVDILDKMPILYGAIDTYLCTSRVEGGPVPILEALACERPVVTTPVGHVPEVIEDGVTGLIAPIDDAQALANSVERILSDRAYAHRLAQTGLKSIQEKWTWDQVLEPLAEMYLQIAQSPNRNKRKNLKKIIIAGVKLFAHSTSHHLH